VRPPGGRGIGVRRQGFRVGRRLLHGGGRRRRGLGEDAVVAMTYSYTTRGMYHPPPREELGEIVLDSINADPVGIVKSLGDRAGGEGKDDGDGPPMPPVFVDPPRDRRVRSRVDDGGGGDDDDNGRETTTSSLGGATRPSFLLRPSRVRESSSSVGANDADDRGERGGQHACRLAELRGSDEKRRQSRGVRRDAGHGLADGRRRKGGGCGGGRQRDTGRQFGWRTRQAKLLRDEVVAEDSWE